MGIFTSTANTEWVPKKDFEQFCKDQGFLAISPPIIITKHKVHSIDLGSDNELYYVERSISNGNILHKYNAKLEKNTHEHCLEIIYSDEHDIVVKELYLMNGSDDIHVLSNSGTFAVKKNHYTHPNFPKFSLTGNPKYDLLNVIFLNYDIYSDLLT